MDERRAALYGTPLSKRLQEKGSVDVDDGISIRSKRKNLQQFVKDDQGRRRFHGAFTGGFSAGYFNTVDTVQGFQPKSFLSQRSSHDRVRDGSSTRFQHRPEDYMDEEDFGEFGIAPKKVRLDESYSDQYIESDTFPPILASSSSIGESILKQMGCSRVITRCHPELQFKRKDDYFGLGYSGLSRREDGNHDSNNPLVASLKNNRKLIISGQAFGEGVLDDDDDNGPSIDEYGLDDVKNYATNDRKEKKHHNSQRSHSFDTEQAYNDTDLAILLAGFERTNDGSCNELVPGRTSLPLIPDAWAMPSRSTPYDCTVLDSKGEIDGLEAVEKLKGKFGERFVTSSHQGSFKSSVCSLPSGLLSYDRLKAEGSKKPARQPELKEDVNSSSQEFVINREVIEWHPCSLLCRHFNVPNPYPGSVHSGIKRADPPETKIDDQNKSSPEREIFEQDALMEMVFNIHFDSDEAETIAHTSEDEEDKPCVVEFESEAAQTSHEQSVVRVNVNSSVAGESEWSGQMGDKLDRRASDEECEVVVCEVRKHQPELIILSSSSSSPARSRLDKDEEGDADSDAYGPPLPPIYNTYSSLKTHDLNRRSAKSKRHKKHKKRDR